MSLHQRVPWVKFETSYPIINCSSPESYVERPRVYWFIVLLYIESPDVDLKRRTPRRPRRSRNDDTERRDRRVGPVKTQYACLPKTRKTSVRDGCIYDVVPGKRNHLKERFSLKQSSSLSNPRSFTLQKFRDNTPKDGSVQHPKRSLSFHLL